MSKSKFSKKEQERILKEIRKEPRALDRFTLGLEYGGSSAIRGNIDSLLERIVNKVRGIK